MFGTLLAIGASALLPEEWKQLAAQAIANIYPAPDSSQQTIPPVTPEPKAPDTPGPTSPPPAVHKAQGSGVKPGSPEHAAAVAAGKALAAALKSNAASAAMIRDFQKKAKIDVDGDYGPQTAGALTYFTGETILPKKGPQRIEPYLP